jgi:hypothetical protein
VFNKCELLVFYDLKLYWWPKTNNHYDSVTDHNWPRIATNVLRQLISPTNFQVQVRYVGGYWGQVFVFVAVEILWRGSAFIISTWTSKSYDKQRMLAFGHCTLQNAALDVQISFKNKVQFFPSKRTGISYVWYFLCLLQLYKVTLLCQRVWGNVHFDGFEYAWSSSRICNFGANFGRWNSQGWLAKHKR